MEDAPRKNARPGKPRTLKSVTKACAILNELDQEGGARITDIANTLGLSKGTVYTHIATLREQGFVTKTNQRYKPSLRFLNIGQMRRIRSELYQAARPEIQTLADETGECANLVAEENGWAYILHTELGANTSATTSAVGKRVHLHYLAAGKAILAHLPEPRLEQIVDKHGLPAQTAKTVTEWSELIRELKDVRDRGFALDTGEQFTKIRCVGAPVKDPHEQILGGISVSAPVSRLQGDRLETNLPERVVNTAIVIERNIEYARASE